MLEKTIKLNNGMDFEYLINETNKYYESKKIGYIYKKPTPIRVVKMKKNMIVEGFFEKKSTTDYNGIYKGKYIDFEVKSTNNNTFNVKNNIHDHQFNHLINIIKSGGISFIIILFKKENRIFLIETSNLFNIKTLSIKKSIEIGTEIKLGIFPFVDYLKVVDTII